MKLTEMTIDEVQAEWEKCEEGESDDEENRVAFLGIMNRASQSPRTFTVECNHWKNKDEQIVHQYAIQNVDDA